MGIMANLIKNNEGLNTATPVKRGNTLKQDLLQLSMFHVFRFSATDVGLKVKAIENDIRLLRNRMVRNHGVTQTEITKALEILLLPETE